MVKVLKWVCLGLAALLGLGILAVLLLLWVNRHDQAPNVAMQAELARYQELPLAQNAYFYWAGIDAPAGQPPMELGLSRYKQALLLQQQSLLGQPLPALANPPRSPAIEALRSITTLCKDPKLAACVASHSGQIRALLPAVQPLLARYAEVKALPQFQMLVSGASLYMPANYSTTFSLPKLRLMAAMAEGASPAAQATLLADELAYQRRRMVQANITIERVISEGAIGKLLLYSAELLRQLPVASAPPLLPALAPFTAAEWSQTAAQQGEFKYASTALAQIQTQLKQPFNVKATCRIEGAVHGSDLACIALASLTKALGPWLYQPTATLNLLWQQQQDFRQDYALSCAAPYLSEQTTSTARYGWKDLYAYNPLGHLAMLPSLDMRSDARFKVCRLERQRRITQLQAAFTQLANPTLSLPDWLTQQGQNGLDPFTGKAFATKPGKAEIYYGKDEVWAF